MRADGGGCPTLRRHVCRCAMSPGRAILTGAWYCLNASLDTLATCLSVTPEFMMFGGHRSDEDEDGSALLARGMRLVSIRDDATPLFWDSMDPA
jgi:hypothetical protein